MSYTKSTALLKSEFAGALSLSEKFNIKAGVRPNRQVKAMLSQAVNFLEPVANDIGRKGAVVEVDSAWGSPEVFLDAKMALKMGRSKERTAYLTGTVDVALSQRDYEKLSNIRKAFKLRSDKQAAALSLRVYNSMLDNIWRGNGFTMTSKSGQPMESFDTTGPKALVRGAFRPIVGR